MRLIDLQTQIMLGVSASQSIFPRFLKELLPNNWLNEWKQVVGARYFLIGVLVILCPLLASCKDQRTLVSESSLDFSDKLYAKISAPGTGQVQSKKKCVYVDFTESMQGFINPGSTSAFSTFLKTMPGTLPGCLVYKYGLKTRGQSVETINDLIEETEFDQSLDDPTLYTWDNNPDYRLFQEIVNGKPDDFSVVITDGVQSGPKDEVNTLAAEAIRKWINSGKIFAILINRTQFDGRFFSMCKKPSPGFLDEKVQTDQRPFFAFVFSPNQAELSNFINGLKQKFPNMLDLVFSDEAIQGAIELPTGIQASYDYVSPTGINKRPYYWQMIQSSGLASESEPDPVVKFHYLISSNYPVKSFHIRFARKYSGWNSDSFSPTETIFPEMIERDLKANLECSIPLKSLINQQQAEPFGFVQVEQTPFAIELRNDLLMTLSTNDDSNLEEKDKTYRFADLVNAIVNSHMSDRVFPARSSRLYLTVEK